MSRKPAPNPSLSLPGVTGLTPLDAGGQGEVFVGTWHDGRKVAVRIERLTDHDPETARLRSDQEGDLLARLAHPNLVPLLAHGTTDTSTYVVMEYVEGIDLGREIARRADRPVNAIDSTLPRGMTSAPTRVLDAATQEALVATDASPEPAPPAFSQPDHWRWVAAIGVQLCGALDRLHSAGFLHRDIKPRNVMVTPDGGAVLVDLGLATAGDLVRVASDDPVAGTWAYMSPEQRQRQGLSTRSDIYGVGCTLYECLTGRPPRTIESDGTSTRAVAPSDVRQRSPEVPEAFAEVVAICLDPIPGNRYLSARDLGDDLLAVIAGRPRGWRRRPWSRLAMTAIAVALALALTGMTWWAARTTTPPLVATLAALRAGNFAVATDTVNAAEARPTLLTEVTAALAPEEVDAQRWLAEARGFGRIEVEACPGVAVGFCPADSEYQGVVERWFRPRVAMTFVVEPGRYRIVLLDDTASNSRLAAASATLSARIEASTPFPLRCAEIKSAWRNPSAAAMCTLPNEECSLRLRLTRQEPVEIRFKATAGLQMGRDEIGTGDLRLYLGWVRERFLERHALFAHPDEPKGTCTAEALEGMLREVSVAARGPVQVSFWWAHRLAAFLGGRLPTAKEWALAAAMSYAHDTEHAERTGLPLAPAEAGRELTRPGSEDPRAGALGLNYLLDSAREWTCTPGNFLPGHAWVCPVAAPSRRPGTHQKRISGSILIPSIEDERASPEPAGARLVREIFRP